MNAFFHLLKKGKESVTVQLCAFLIITPASWQLLRLINLIIQNPESDVEKRHCRQSVD